jgi:pimeloyl-ACP methyl ester carboxylesterase
MRSRRRPSRPLPNVALSAAAAAVVAPVASLASRVLTHPVLPHAIAAPRRMLTSKEAGRISYYEDDSASGLPLVLLHGLGPAGSAYEVRGLFDALRAERPVVAVDLPGFGFSERRDTAPSRDSYVAFVEELLTDVSRRYGASVDVVAIGVTGELVARAVLGAPRLVRSLALVAPTGFGLGSRASRVFASRLGASISEALRSRITSRVAHAAMASKPVLRARIAHATGGRVDPALVSYVHAAAHQPRARFAPLAAFCGALSDPFVVGDVYDELRVPVLFVHGEEPDLAVKELDALVTRHACFRRARVFGSGKAPHLDRAIDTADRLRAFHRSLAVRPQLRLIRGERTLRGPSPRRAGGGRMGRRADRGGT